MYALMLLYTIEDLKAITAEYRAKTRELRRAA
jgi:hypothetical protein